MVTRTMRSAIAVLVSVVFVAGMVCADVGAPQGDTAQLLNTIKDLQDQIGGLQNQVKDLQSKPAAAVPNNDLEKKIQSLQDEVNKLRAQSPVATPQVATASGTMPAWLEGTTFGGDIMVRLQTESVNHQSSFSLGDASKSDYNDRSRGRLRLRYVFAKQITDELMAKFRIATGNGNRRGHIATMGNSDGGFDALDVWIDQAYLKYAPNKINGLTLFGGKFEKNWKDKGFLIHEEGCGFDGIGESYVYKFNDSVSADLNLAQLIVSEGTAEDSDSEVYVFDGGFGGTVDTDMSPIRWGARGTMYVFAGYHDGGFSELSSGTGAAFNNNDTMESPIVYIGTLDLGFDIKGYEINTFVQGGFNGNEDTKGTDNQGANKYYSLGLEFNKIKKAGDWLLGYKYAYMERNAFPDGLVDADLGVGDQGHIWYGKYRLLESTDLEVSLAGYRTLEADRDMDRFIGKFSLITRF